MQCFSFEQAWNTGRLGLTKHEMGFAIKRMRLEFVAEREVRSVRYADFEWNVRKAERLRR